MMSEGILVAIIGALGVIAAAWIGARVRGHRRDNTEMMTRDIVGRDKIGGDVVGRDKIETHDHLHLEGSEAEQKATFVYFLEKLFTFVFTFVVAGLIFGVIGFLIGREVGGAIGLLLASIAGIVNAGNVKRRKGVI